MLLEDDRLHYEPGLPVEVIDTTGAGDVFRGAFIAALLRGDTPADILRFANTAAALSCTRSGAIDGIPAIEEVERCLRGYRFSSRNPSGGTISDNDCS
jgi:sugar/nucleoside kinase (ribokinase family)